MGAGKGTSKRVNTTTTKQKFHAKNFTRKLFISDPNDHPFFYVYSSFPSYDDPIYHELGNEVTLIPYTPEYVINRLFSKNSPYLRKSLRELSNDRKFMGFIDKHKDELNETINKCASSTELNYEIYGDYYGDYLESVAIEPWSVDRPVMLMDEKITELVNNYKLALRK